MSRMVGSTAGGMRVVFGLMPVLALATIANEQVHGRLRAVLGLLIGIGWLALALAAFILPLLQRPNRIRRKLERVIASADPETAAKAWLDLGVLSVAQDDADGARVAFQRALDTGQGDIAAKAAFNLGLLHHTHGEPEAAIAAYRQAISSGDPDYGPMAANNMAQVLRQKGDIAAARAAYRLAIDSGHPEQSLIAMHALDQMR